MDVYCLDSCSASKGRKVQTVRLRCLKSWARAGGVMLVGYECFRQVAQSNSAHLSVKSNASAQQLLLNTADLCVADEAHRVRNSKSALARAVAMLRTRRRIALTGTPIQNNTLELFSMCEFVAPGFLGSEAEFRLRFDGPIRRGQCTDSSAADVRQMQRRVHVLHKKLQPIVHRVDYSDIQTAKTDNSDELVASAPDPHSIHNVSQLPTKHEFVLFARMSALQRQLYQRFIATHRMSLLKAYHSLQRINNHPSCLESTAAVLDADFDVSDGDSDDDAEPRGKKRRHGNEASSAAAAAAAAGSQSSAWYGDLLSPASGYVAGRIEDSGKLLLCVFLLTSAFRAQERVLIFSQSLDMIDLLENVLERYFGLKKNTGYFRLDGASMEAVRTCANAATAAVGIHCRALVDACFDVSYAAGIAVAAVIQVRRAPRLVTSRSRPSTTLTHRRAYF